MINTQTENATRILNYDHETVQDLIEKRHWRELEEREKIGAMYSYVKDEMRFGYNADDSLPASAILADGYGQCNTKGTVLMTLLRAVGVECRFHGFTIYNELQKGAIPSYVFWLAPKEIIHSWIEVKYEGRWIELEGFILDPAYLDSIQNKFNEAGDIFSGYGIATTCFRSPNVEWDGGNTYIQSEGIARDLGVYETPDKFYAEHGTNLKGLRKFLYARVVRHLINAHVDRLRRRPRNAIE